MTRWPPRGSRARAGSSHVGLICPKRPPAERSNLKHSWPLNTKGASVRRKTVSKPAPPFGLDPSTGESSSRCCAAYPLDAQYSNKESGSNSSAPHSMQTSPCRSTFRMTEHSFSSPAMWMRRSLKTSEADGAGVSSTRCKALRRFVFSRTVPCEAVLARITAALFMEAKQISPASSLTGAEVCFAEVSSVAQRL